LIKSRSYGLEKEFGDIFNFVGLIEKIIQFFFFSALVFFFALKLKSFWGDFWPQFGPPITKYSYPGDNTGLLIQIIMFWLLKGH
jgi:hypothetical protein